MYKNKTVCVVIPAYNEEKAIKKVVTDFIKHKYVDKVIVIEELDPFLQENIQAMGIEVMGKEFIPLVDELNPSIIEKAAISAGLLEKTSNLNKSKLLLQIPEPISL